MRQEAGNAVPNYCLLSKSWLICDAELVQCDVQWYLNSNSTADIECQSSMGKTCGRRDQNLFLTVLLAPMLCERADCKATVSADDGWLCTLAGPLECTSGGKDRLQGAHAKVIMLLLA